MHFFLYYLPNIYLLLDQIMNCASSLNFIISVKMDLIDLLFK